jgi:type II secretory pathway pseudopilin PulG
MIKIGMASLLVANAGHYRIGEPQLQQGCSGIECTIGEVLSSELLLVTVAVFAAVALIAFTYLANARRECSEEQRRVRDEKKAFEQFVQGIGRLQATTVQPQVATEGGAMVKRTNSPATSQVGDVYKLYENTVMQVPHYEMDYGEPLRENMAIELGEEVTTALDTASRFTPQIKQALVQKGIETKDSRERFLRTLEAESESLQETNDALANIDRRVDDLEDSRRLRQSFDELEHHWWELDALEEECESVLERRQQQVRSGSPATHWRGDGHGLCAYLYSSLPVEYPALAEGALLYDRIKTAKRKFTESLTRRV